MVNQDRFIQEGIYDHYKMDETTQVPVDDVGLFSYHMQHLMSEVGEVLDSDKRWKTHRMVSSIKMQSLMKLPIVSLC